MVCAQAQAKSAEHHRQLNQTTWTYVEDGKHLRMTIDARGNYVETTAGGQVVGRGTAIMKRAKDCFTPIKSPDGEHCWTSKPLRIGQSMVSISDKGEKLKVRRIAYRPMRIPK